MQASIRGEELVVVTSTSGFFISTPTLANKEVFFTKFLPSFSWEMESRMCECQALTEGDGKRRFFSISPAENDVFFPPSIYTYPYFPFLGGDIVS